MRNHVCMKSVWMARIVFLLMVCFVGVVESQGQSYVKGTVSDSNGEPLIGVSILVKGELKGVISDINGGYSIPADVSDVLQFSYVGYVTQEIKVGNDRIINVTLEEDTRQLEEVVVVGYGTQKKVNLTGAVSSVSADELANKPVMSTAQAIAGLAPGLSVVSNSGRPGAGARVKIRGTGTFSNAGTDPLVLIDGLSGSMDDVDPNDIESISFLKDAASASIYGVRAANGVILVTTKKGKSGDTQISLDARWGVNSRLVKNYDVLQNANTYMETAYSALYNGYLYNSGYTAEQAYQLANADLFPKLGYQVYTIPDGQYLIGRNGKLNPHAALGYSDGDYYYTPDNWSDEMFQSNLRQEYNLSVSGGSDKLSYYLSASYLNDEGIIENSGFERISTRMNVDYQAKKWLKLGVNLSYSNVTSRSPGDQDTDAATSSGNAFFVGNFIAPIYPMYVRNADGSFQYNANTGYHVYDYGDGSSTNFTRNFMSMSNPMSGFLYDTEKYLMDILNGKWYAKIDIIDGLSLTASLGLHIDNTRQHSVGNKYYGQSASYGGSVMQYSSRVYSLDQQYLLNYKKTFGNHNLDILAGYESMDFNTESHYILGYNMYSDKNWTASNVIDRKNGSGSYNEYATIGIITRASYDFNEKYYGSVSYRRDASSRFHPDNRWGNFWSVSAAWDMAKEDFISQYDWINMLKLKASFGQQGNDNLYYKGYTNYYPYLDQFTVSGSDGVFSDGVLYYKGSKDITWETSNSFNVGVDFALLGGRIDGTIEYFNRQTKDMLYYKPVAMSNGYTQLPMNIGSVRNSGVEIELNYTPIETNDLKWVINWNGTLMKNKILELHPDLKGEMIDGSYIYREGESLYQMYLTKYAGVDPDSGEALYWAKDENGVEYKDKDWSAAYNSNRQASGDLLPTIYGGVGTTLEFRGFDFSIQCAYQLGGTIYDSGYQAFMHGGDSHYMGYNWHKDILNAWTPENRNTNIPRVDAIDKYTNSSSDRWLTSSDYFSINNITLGYTLPKRWLRSLGIGSLRIYGAADNVALFSARKGLDPRMSYTTASTDRYTPIRTISGGLKVTF